MKTRLILVIWVVVCISELVWTKEDVTNLVPFAEWIDEVNQIDSHPHGFHEECSGCILNEKPTNHSSKAISIKLTTNCKKEEANGKYLLQVLGDSEGSLKPGQWTGHIIIRFSNYSNDGQKFQTCLLVTEESKKLNITRFEGHFIDGKLQGKVDITYETKPQLVLTGNAVDGILVGSRRYFVKDKNKYRLENAYSTNGKLVIAKDPYGWRQKLSERKVYFSTLRDDVEDFVCDGEMEDVYHLNCRNVKRGARVMFKDQIKSGVWNPTIADGGSFSYNRVIDERQNIPSSKLFCPESLRTWIAAVSDLAYDPWWNSPEETDPVGGNHPSRLDINFSHLSACDDGHFILNNQYGVLRRGNFTNGTVSINWNATSDTLQSWRGTLHLVVAKDKASLAKQRGDFVGRRGYIMRDDNTLNIFFRMKGGKVSGLVQQFGMVDNEHCQLACVKYDSDEMNKHSLGYLGFYDNGKPLGYAWKGINKGWIHGKLDEKDGSFTGDKIAYIYHDLEVALVGKFVNSTMEEAQESEVQGSTCDEFGIKKLDFATPHGPKFHYSPQTRNSFGDQPLVEDPLDKKYMSIRESEIGVGEGAYATRDISKGAILAIYGGHLFTSQDYSEVSALQTVEREKFRRSGKFTDSQIEDIAEEYYTYRLGRADNCQGIIDIPHDLGSREQYKATIGHKLQDDPYRTHGAYETIDHPRFGNIMAVVAQRDVKKGQEVLAFYGYGLKKGGGPRWYQNALLKGATMCHALKVSYWPQPLTHFDRVFCDNTNWNSEMTWASIDTWLSYITWKRFQKAWNTQQPWNSVDPITREVSIYLSFLSKHGPMDYSVTGPNGASAFGTMVNGTIAFKLSPKEDITMWNDYLRFQFRKQQSRRNVEAEEIEVYLRLMNGRPKGLVRMFGKIPMEPSAFHHVMCREPGLGFIGHYEDGKLVGPSWQGLMGGGWIYGVTDQHGEFSGDSIAYIYPDNSTALLGEFRKGKMLRGRAVEVLSERCNIYNIKELKFSEPTGPVYQYTPQGPEDFGSQYMRDPLDKKYVQVGPSAYDDGLFAVRPIPKGTVFALYGGHVLSDLDMTKRVESYRPQLTKLIESEKYTDDQLRQIYELTWMYRFRVPNQACDRSIDIPYEFGKSVTNYNATLGHKINHGPGVATNADIISIDTPRFGLINGVKATRNIGTGDQIFLTYVFERNKGPTWYNKLREKTLREFEEKYGPKQHH